MLLPIAMAGLVLFGWCSSTLGQSAASLRADGAGPSASVIVVRPAGWETALAEWSRYRSSQYRIIELDSGKDSGQQRQSILNAIRQANPPATAILLCGDSMVEVPLKPEDKAPVGAKRKFQILTPGVTVPTTVQLGSFTTPDLGTDAHFADVDGDGCPDLSIGRIPVKTPGELQRFLHRSIEYEAMASGPWNDTLHVTAGVGGFGVLADTAIEAVTRRFLTEGIPDHFHLQMTYTSCTSTYCPNPYQLREAYIERINRGGLFWVYIGHGAVTHLDAMQVGEQFLPIGDAADAARFRVETRPPIAIMLACFTGAFDATADCFSERLLDQPSGPIAVISGSRVTMPYGLSQFASELINGCFRDRIPTLGEIVLEAKRRTWEMDETETADAANSTAVAAESGQNAKGDGRIDIRKRYRKIVTDMAQALSPGDHSLVEERREHVRLMNLFGDPLLRIPYPDAIALNVPATATAGETLRVEGTAPTDGRLVVELSLMRDRLPEGVTPIDAYDGSAAQLEQMQSTYERSSQLVLSKREANVQAGPFREELIIPASIKGRCVVSAYVYGQEGWAVGSRRIVIRQAK
ncbi:MAG: C25 family cysteine peptidase [Pirellula sp.]